MIRAMTTAGAAKRPLTAGQVLVLERVSLTHHGLLASALRAALLALGLGGCGAHQQVPDASCDQPCVTIGACTQKGGSCIATRDDDCRQSALCPAEGRCVAKKGLCVAGKETDCKQSEVCKTSGQCMLRASACVSRADMGPE